MTRIKDRSNWVAIRCAMLKHPAFLRLAKHLAIEPDDLDGRYMLVGKLHTLWSHIYLAGTKRFDHLEDVAAMTGLDAEFLDALIRKDVAWIRRVAPTDHERRDRLERGYSEAEAEAKWFEVRSWGDDVKKRSGEREIQKDKKERKFTPTSLGQSASEMGLAMGDKLKSGVCSDPKKVLQDIRNHCDNQSPRGSNA